ncbi:MAG: D-2-hydroxyacid dehydrogenase [Pseudomonadota bacterium]
MKGVFLDRATVAPRDLDWNLFESSMDDWEYYDSTSLAEIESRVRDSEVIVTNKVKIDSYVLESARKLKLICVAATGYNNIDLEAAKAFGVTVCNVSNYSTASVVQHTFSLILALRTSLTKYHARTVRGAWQNSLHFCLLDFPVTEISGTVMGIIGYGNIGRAVAKVAEAFGMQVLIGDLRNNGSQDRVPLETLYAQSDVISLHCPLTPETQGLIDHQALTQMKKNALIINTARGGIINETDLAVALKNRDIGGAGMDVLTQEPPIDGNPLLEQDIPNCIVTPHTAWTSREARQTLINTIAKNIRAFHENQPQNVVSS